ncbi:MAG: PhzF family phenazine biosynthesis protein [Alphaproteobacteria bacterium]|nr:PhzF family phenazine biosynthesis protein [Alphaproteobacteria bacterium]MBV9693949.1 PhzF family phenazine biosynthesis protein [Alphaproteobacteria bacterium]
MELKIFQVDAFASRPLEGNPAAIVPLESWLDERLMQRIANENNLAETAFFVRLDAGHYQLRWFTPESEVDLCGHATLAGAWIIFAHLDPALGEVAFETRSGILTVTRGADGRHVMSLPSDPPEPRADDPGLRARIAEALETTAPDTLLQGRYLTAVWGEPRIVRALRGPGAIAQVLRPLGQWGLVATAPGDEGYDVVSRFFAPDKGVPEDPVTGSAHCLLTPYWARRLGKSTLKARQASPRGGDLVCTDAGTRTILSGPCALYMTGEIVV